MKRARKYTPPKLTKKWVYYKGRPLGLRSTTRELGLEVANIAARLMLRYDAGDDPLLTRLQNIGLEIAARFDPFKK